MKNEVLNLSDLLRYISGIPKNKLVFWVGAGVDNKSPTSLPLANALTEHVLRRSCNSYYEPLIRVWQENRKAVQQTVDKTDCLEFPRLETVIEAIKTFESHQINCKSVIAGIESFSTDNIKPNANHYSLATLLHQGANVVTTNYGDFIAKAYQELYGDKSIAHNQDKIHFYSVDNGYNSCIFHIHGVSSDVNTIGANLSNVKNKLPDQFTNVFQKWLLNEYCIIYLGYSGADSLDVNPYLMSLDMHSKSSGVYIRHPTGNTHTSNNFALSKREQTLLNPFGVKILCPCEASEFLHQLSPSIQNNSIQDSNKWKILFNQRAAKYDDDYAEMQLLSMCYILGINIESVLSKRIQVPQKANNIDYNITNFPNVNDWFKNYFAFENAVFTGNKKLMHLYGKRLKKRKGKLELLDYYSAVAPPILMVFFLKDPKVIKMKILKTLKEENKIDWSVSTPLNRSVEVIFEVVSMFPFWAKGIFKALQRSKYIYHLNECFNIIINSGYDRTIDINQINTALRSASLCAMIQDPSDDSAIFQLYKVIENYADTSSINGIVNTLLYITMCNIIKMISSVDKNSFYKLIENNLFASETLIIETGLRKYQRKYNIMNILFNYLRKNC